MVLQPHCKQAQNQANEIGSGSHAPFVNEFPRDACPQAALHKAVSANSRLRLQTADGFAAVGGRKRDVVCTLPVVCCVPVLNKIERDEQSIKLACTVLVR